MHKLGEPGMKKFTLGRLFLDRARILGSKVAVRFKEGSGPYQSMSWQDFLSLVEEIGFGLSAVGLRPGQAVGIFASTSHLWVAADLSTVCNGALSVPLYPNCCLSDVEHILNNSEAELVFVCGEPLLAKILQVKEQLPLLKKVIYITPLSGGKSADEIRSKNNLSSEFLIGFGELRELGRAVAKTKPELLEERINNTTLDATATIIYTSGTTGTPKGVTLTHNNIVSLLTPLPSVLALYETDVYLSYLPLSHVFERICGEYYWIYAGGTNAFAESIELFAKNLSEVEPTYLLAVPRVLDRIYAKVKSGIEGATGKARQMIEWSIGVGVEIMQLKADEKPIRPMLKIKHWLAERIVFRKLRDRIGKNLRFIICGGAPATPHVLEFFNAIGIPTLEGYGLTETTAPTNVNRPGKIKVGTVGPILPTVEMKLAADGEILVRGESIFGGYFKDPEATAEVFENGWFKTGDVGFLDQDGYLKITDRKKDIIVNCAGKNIAPQRIETLLRTIPQVSQAIVFGDKRKHLVAIFTMDENATVELARERGWPFESFEQLTQSSDLYRYIKKEINLRSGKLADYEAIRNFIVLKKDLSVDSGELTATLKVKRSVIAKKYANTINALYKDELVAGS
jgi:long-chain acyl-CoA synthetase